MIEFKGDIRSQGNFLYGKKKSAFTVLYRLYDYCWPSQKGEGRCQISGSDVRNAGNLSMVMIPCEAKSWSAHPARRKSRFPKRKQNRAILRSRVHLASQDHTTHGRKVLYSQEEEK